MSSAHKREHGLRKFLRELLHHWLCNRTWVYPYDGHCSNPRCGNWLDNAGPPA